MARRLIDWLERRPQLGRKVFARVEPEPAADLTALLRACLTLLELPARERIYRPNPPPLWRVPDALARMRRLLAAMLQGAALEAFLPTGGGQRPTARLQRRSLASTLVAGLELSRNGAALLDQDAGFGGIVVRPGDAGGALASRDAAARPKQRPRCNRGRFPGRGGCACGDGEFTLIMSPPDSAPLE